VRPARPILAFGLALLAACGGRATEPALDGMSPFGAWRSRSGTVLIVPRKGPYTLCDPGGCASGEVRTVFAGSGANLLGFWSLPAGRRLRARAIGAGPHSASDEGLFQLATGKIPASDEKRLCGSSPCVLVGSVGDPDPERFSKIADY
jgi:hypothetical protein